MASTILHVEDDPHSVELASLYLMRDGHRVFTAADGDAGLRLAREVRPDLILLDLMLPRMDGYEVCRQLREESNVPIIMVTARIEEDERTAGLDLGADDYVTKPFSPRELAARVRAVLRRAARDAARAQSGPLIYGDLVVDPEKHSVQLREESLKLTPTEFRLLNMFVREPGRTFTRDQIIDQAFGYDFDGFDRTVDSHISSLRGKLEKASADGSRLIHTVYGVGYKFGHA